MSTRPIMTISPSRFLLFLVLLLISNGVSAEQSLKRKPVGYYDELIHRRTSTGDYQEVRPGVTKVQDDNNTTVTFRHLSAFIPFSLFGQLLVTSSDQATSLLMAAYHFNNRIATIVPELANLQDCDIRLTLDIFDTKLDPVYAAHQLYAQVRPRIAAANQHERRMYPTGLIGGITSKVSQSLGVLGGVYEMTQVSYASGSEELENTRQYPFFGRTVSSARVAASLAADFFYQEFHATHVFVVYNEGSFGSDYSNFFADRASELGIITMGTAIGGGLQCTSCLAKDIENALTNMEAFGSRYVFSLITGDQHEVLLPQALERGFAGENTFWLYIDTRKSRKPFAPGDPLIAATRGSGVFGPATSSHFDTSSIYLEEWKLFVAADERRPLLDSVLPQEILNNPSYSAYDVDPLSSSDSLAYDAFMSLALSTCDAATTAGANFSATAFHEAFLNQDFSGATNRVKFSDTGTRTKDTALYAVSNLQETVLDDGSTTFDEQISFIYSTKNGSDHAAWNRLPNRTFVYSDGTLTPPMNLPPVDATVVEIELWASVLGYFICVLIVGVAVGFCIWMEINVKAAPIRAAQPFFVRILAAGIVFMAMSLVPQASLAFSEYPDQLCVMSPWFLAIGFCFTFSALFTKLMRMNKIEKSSKRMRRVTIQAHDVLATFLLLLALNVAILTTWTVYDPLQYELVSTGDVDRFGRELRYTATCSSESSVWFRIGLTILDLIALSITGYQAWQTRNTQIAFNENKTLAMALLISSQSFLIGIPLAAAVTDPSAQFFCRCAAVLWGCLGFFCPIVFPRFGQVKRWRAAKIRKEAEKRERNARTTEYFIAIS